MCPCAYTPVAVRSNVQMLRKSLNQSTVCLSMKLIYRDHTLFTSRLFGLASYPWPGLVAGGIACSLVARNAGTSRNRTFFRACHYRE